MAKVKSPSNSGSSRTSASAISWLKLPLPKRYAPEVQALHEGNRERLGYVRHFLELPFEPKRLAHLQSYIDLLVRGEDGELPIHERELIALVVSVENRCEVCVVTHAGALQAQGVDKKLIDVLIVNWRRAELNARELALAAFAARLTREPEAATATHLEALRKAGLKDEEILEAVQIVAVFNLTNRLNSGLGVRLNAETHAQFRN